ncbi:MAG: B12-binding domain-containing radical SAM protein, partial [Deltaproteobacteria bacterium]|nr:B12-binding domain-containing radical SAM protein [Deltaproteobacteria bacterium]
MTQNDPAPMDMPAQEHPYARFIERVNKPAQYLGGEAGELRKDWDGARGRMCLAFPDLYEVGMSHLGFKILYGVLNAHPDLLAERAYAPALDMEAALREEHEPLRSLESWRALGDFDVVGFSLQFELTFTNILTMLDLGGIPLRAEARGEDDPLVVAGGPVATHPEPISPFLDCLVIGDGEERTPELVLLWSELK